MYGFLLALLIIDGLFLSVIVLLQSGKGGGLAAMGGGGGTGGTDSLIGGRQAATLLTKATWVSGGMFLGLALVLAVLSSRQDRAEPILRGEFQQQQAPTPIVPGTQPAEPGAPQPVLPGTSQPEPGGAAPPPEQ